MAAIARTDAACSGTKPMALVSALLLTVAGLGGCQSVFPTGLPSTWKVGEEARIAKQAKADSFPSPADVGLGEPTSVP
jgi:hypothetical protein